MKYRYIFPKSNYSTLDLTRPLDNEEYLMLKDYKIAEFNKLTKDVGQSLASKYGSDESVNSEDDLSELDFQIGTKLDYW